MVTPVVGVGAIITDHAGRVLVVQRARPPGQGKWAVPGGKVRAGESLRDTARREIREETGLHIEVGPVAWVGETVGAGDPPRFHIVLIDFWATIVGGEDPRAGDDADDLDWVDPLQPHRALVPSMYRMFTDLYGAPPESGPNAAALPPSERPFTAERYTTQDLPATPTRSFRIPAVGWIEAPGELLELGDALNEPVEYKRRIGRYLLWRAGPPVGEAEYLAISADDLSERYRFRLSGKTGAGYGPDGRRHERFRTWKESLRDA